MSRVVATLLLAALVASCTGGRESVPERRGDTTPPGTLTTPASADPPLRRVRIDLKKIEGGFSAPLYVTHDGVNRDRLYVVEQGGLVRVIERGALLPEPFLDLTSLTVAAGEQGLLGLAFHPRFEKTKRLFVHYTDVDGDTVVSEYRASGATADPGSGSTLLTVDQPYPNHNGGQIGFGPDGYLYVGLGDGGGAGDPFDNGQSLDTLLGKILRIDVGGGRRGGEYRSPPDNPFVGKDDARAEIWAYGLRNPWRFSFDDTSGELWVADVGQDELEEINRVPASAAGLDYGWNDMEASRCYEPSTGCSRGERVLPVAESSHDDGC